MPPQFASLPHHLESIRSAALEAVDPERAVRAHLSFDGRWLACGGARVELPVDARVLLVGAGKAGVAMARAAAGILGERLAAGVVSVPGLPESPIPRVECVRGGHPVPTEGSLEAGRKIAGLLQGLAPGDVVLAVISGGGSALLELLPPGVALADLQATTEALLRSGAAIRELNTVRQSISRLKGGGLARLSSPARLIALILSDVVGDPLDVVASGPTVPTPTTPADALRVLERYELLDRVPRAVSGFLRRAAGEERPPALDESRVTNVLVGSNAQAAEAAAARASELGFRSMVLSTFVEGEAREVGRVVAGLGKGIRRHGHPVGPPACVVMGGETTVTVRGSGRGGRNQELALAAAIALDGWEGIAVMSFGTDGIDGPTDAAGAYATGETVRRARERSLSAPAALAANDAHTFFASLGGLIVTGPTGTNVNDLMAVLVY